MKFFTFAFIAALCLVAVTANANINEEFDVPQGSAEEIIDIELQGFKSILKTALRTLKGMNCTIKEVLVIRDAANKFIDDMTACGGIIPKNIQTLINACKDIVETCKAIIGVSETICGNPKDEQEVDPKARWSVVAGAQNGHKCFVKMLRKLLKLNSQINRAIKLIKQITKVPGNVSQCTLTAVNALEKSFIDFPSNIKTCSVLVSPKP